ncbi:alpha/beta fold hydrolase [Caproiciproducens faecalis]|uniref:Lysophospholipase n=1 Tax=Caproiciproducens faecalis TaxID=2820301 RepID=A0ABS7DQC9_9FIRM|nr:alpha/beta fold hydrolase [Caproiciproducens faecalis]MBW7573514.1 lysophospholipase [Caproiciproducens faecalis]
MDILQRQMSFDSCTDDERIFARVFEPADKTDVRAVLQIAHGMAEHSLLYVDFARALAAKGYSVAINDHLGHGKSVTAGGAYGYFGKGGCQNLVKDMHKLYGLMRKDYPNIPYVLMGHSMGSFLARSYAAQYGDELTAVIFMGTCGSPGAAVLSTQKRISNAIVKKKGEKSHDPIFAKLSTGKYNSAFTPFRTPNDWISRDGAQVDIYTNDPLCGFDLTASGYRDIVYLQAEVNSSGWFKKMAKIPILLISGGKDPVGGFGKGVRQVAAKLRKTGHEVRLILYPEARHALLSEINRDEVYEDIEDFLSSVTMKECQL